MSQHLVPAVIAIVFCSLASVCRGQDEPVFSGPQVGETLAPFAILDALRDGEKLDLVKQADGKPIAIIFVHGVTRPSIGVLRGVMKVGGLAEAVGAR